MSSWENWETECPKRKDKIHCVHWYDGEACCDCGDSGNIETFEDEVTQRDGTLCLQERIFSMLPKTKFKRGDRVRVTIERLNERASGGRDDARPSG